MLIASKYEEIWAPELTDFIYISDKAYTRGQIIQMEKMMLNVLKFTLTVPTAYTFLGRLLKVIGPFCFIIFRLRSLVTTPLHPFLLS
jgi:G2/mitotic-specific cyclin-B, other